MKQPNNLAITIKGVVLVFLLSLTSLIAWAQEKKTDININVNKNSEWYNQPWVWVVGGAVFLLLLIALLRGGGNKD